MALRARFTLLHSQSYPRRNLQALQPHRRERALGGWWRYRGAVALLALWLCAVAAMIWHPRRAE